MTINEETLCRYYDGELTKQERERVEQLLAGSESSRRTLENSVRLSELFVLLQEESLRNVSFDGFDKQVMNRIHRRQKSLGVMDRLRVFSREFFEYRKRVWVPAVSLLGAAAATAVLILSVSEGQTPVMPESAPPSIWQAAASTERSVSQARIVNLDEVSGQEYTIPMDAHRNIAVVWIDD